MPRRSFFILILLISSSAAGTNEQKKIDDCLKLLPRITTPEIGTPPRAKNEELPAWTEEPLNSQWDKRRHEYGMTQQGGGRDFNYANQTLSGEEGLKVVSVSNPRFEQAKDWGQLEGWLKERLEIANAPEYRDRSEYWVTLPLEDRTTSRSFGVVTPLEERKKPILGSKIETTYGITWGKYSRKDIEGKTDQEIYTNTTFRLPEEKTLQKPVHRYFDSKGNGIAIEFRAVSKDPKTTPNWLRDEGLNQMILGILKVAKDYPELYDKPIVTCYADENHRGLYEHWMKMKIQNETTPLDNPVFIHNKDGTIDKRVPWWYIEVSPRDLERVLMARTQGSRTLANLNQPHPFKLPDGREVMAAAKAPISFDSNGDVTLATLNETTELQEGVIAEKGATAFWIDRHLVRVSAIHSPFTFNLTGRIFPIASIKVIAPKGATIEWDHPYLIKWHKKYHNKDGEFHYKPDFDGENREFVEPWVSTGISAGRGEYDPWDVYNYNLRRGRFPDSVEDDRNILNWRRSNFDPKPARAISSNDHPILLPDLGIQASEVDFTNTSLTVRLAQDFVTQDGLKAARGSDLLLKQNKDKWKWERIFLAGDCVVNGIAFKKGTLLVRIRGPINEDLGIRAYVGPKNYKDYLY